MPARIAAPALRLASPDWSTAYPGLAEAPDGPGAPLVAVENSYRRGDSIGVKVEQLAAVLELATRTPLTGASASAWTQLTCGRPATTFPTRP